MKILSLSGYPTVSGFIYLVEEESTCLEEVQILDGFAPLAICSI